MADVQRQEHTSSSVTPALAADVLTLRKVLLFGIVGLGLFPVLLTAAGSAVYAGGRSAWLAELIGVAGIGLVAVPIVTFARRHTVTGSVMSLLGEECGPGWQPMPGAALLAGYVCALIAFTGSAVLFVGSFTNDIGFNVAGDLVFQIPVILLTLLGTSWMASRGVNASVEASIVMGFVLAPFALLIVIASSIKGGVQLGDQLQLRGFDSTTFVQGILFAVAIFSGFEGLTALGRETRNPQRAMPRVLMTLVPVLGGTLVIGALLEIPLLLEHTDQLGKGVSPAAVLADVGGVGWVKAPTDLLTAVGAFALVTGYLTDASRIVATMGRDGGLPAWTGQLHDGRRTPARATWTVGFLTAAVAVAYLAIRPGSLLIIATDFAELTAYLWLIAYAAVCVGGVVYGIRTRTRSPGVAVASALGLLFVLGCYLWPILHEAEGFAAASPYVALSWTAVVGALIAVGQRRRSIAGGNLAADTHGSQDGLTRAPEAGVTALGASPSDR